MGSLEDRLRRLEARRGGGAYETPLYARVFLKQLAGEPLTDEEAAWDLQADERLLSEYIPHLMRTEVSEESREFARQLEAHIREKLDERS